jgi:hypothetical protein
MSNYMGRLSRILSCLKVLSKNRKAQTKYMHKKQALTIDRGRAIAQAVSRRLPTAAARVQTRLGTWDFVMDESGAGAGFLRELRFPLPIYTPS